MRLDFIDCGNCVDLMRDLPNECIDLTVTSPPYDNLRKYNGFDFDYISVIKELHRITKQNGVVVWVVGDATINGSETGTSFKEALAFMDTGFKLHDTMIYEKIAALFQQGRIQTGIRKFLNICSCFPKEFQKHI